MPFGDGTGPVGNGPMTGRGMGYCAGYRVPGYLNRPGYGRGLGRGRGFGRGFGRGYRYVPYSAPAYPYNQEVSRESETEYLKETARSLEEELKYVKEQLKKLEENNND